jgi:ribosome biogenesis GTPase
VRDDQLDAYGLDDRVRALAAEGGSDATLGRVTRIDRGFYSVITQRDTRRASLSGELKDAPEPEDRPAIGDWVLLGGDGVLEVVLDRRSAFRRGDAERLRAQVVAANIDVAFVVHASNDEPNLRRLERELALAWESGAIPVVVLTKADECASPDDVAERVTTGVRGVDVVITSAYQRVGLDALVEFARPNRTVAFIGASGVGKSSLVNALVDDDVQDVAAVRESDGRGRHTTTHRELFLLPGGGVLIDTPGLRTIGMWQSDEGISKVFADIEELASRCRFSDCTHSIEPGCAVRIAIDAGALDEARVKNYRSMLAELDALDRASEVRARLDKKRHAKMLSKAVRSMPQRKPR